MNYKRVFVTGGAGIIGSSLVDQLLKEKIDLYVGDLKPCPKRWLGHLIYRQGDLNFLSKEEIQQFDPECVFHLAATFERSEETQPFFRENFHHNIQLSHHLLECFKDCPSLKKIIFASSYLTYDPSLYQFKEPQLQSAVLKEESPVYPRNLCGIAKLLHEYELSFIQSFSKHSLSCLSVRIFRVYGRGSRDVISKWIRAALSGQCLSVFCPEGRFDYIYAEDVSKGLIRLAEQENSGIVNLGSGTSHSIEEVIKILLSHFPNLEIKKEESSIPYEASQASIKRLNRWINWKPISLEEGIEQVIQFEREQKQRKFTQKINKGVLITSISKKMPLIDAVRSAVNQVGEFQEVHGADCDSMCIGQYGVDEFWCTDPLPQMSIKSILSYCLEHQITAIIPTRNEDVEFYARHQNAFKKKGIHILVSSLKTVSICLDKKEFANFLSHHGLPVIPTFLSLDETPDFSSYVVKERRGAGSIQIALNVSRDQAAKAQTSFKEPIFQPFCSGMEWSIDIYRSFDGHVKGCVARQRNYIVKGESQVTTTASHPILEELCEKMAHLLDLKGHAVFQVIEDPQGKCHILECNPRFGGASTASLAVGLNSFVWFFMECLGENLVNYPFFRSSQNIRQIRYAADRIIPWLSSST